MITASDIFVWAVMILLGFTIGFTINDPPKQVISACAAAVRFVETPLGHDIYSSDCSGKHWVPVGSLVKKEV